MASDYDWCYPCNQPHNQTTCLNGILYQALMVQNNVIVLEDSTHGTHDQQISHSEQGPNVTLVNWQGEEFCGVNQPQDQNQSYTSIAANTQSKKRAIDIGQQADKGINQTSISQQAPPGPQPTLNIQIVPKGKLVVNKDQPRGQLHTPQVQEDVVVKREQQKVSTSSFNILDQLKKMHVSVSMWDSLALPRQKYLLKNALSNISLSQELPNEKPKVVLSNAPQEKKGEQKT